MKTFLGYVGWIGFYVVSVFLAYILGIFTMLKIVNDTAKDFTEKHKKSFEQNSFKT